MIKQTDSSQALQELKAFGIRRFGIHWNERYNSEEGNVPLLAPSFG
jgi:hypothetical protein